MTRQTSTFAPVNGPLGDEQGQWTDYGSRLPKGAEAASTPSLPRRMEGNGLGLSKRRLQTMQQIASEALLHELTDASLRDRIIARTAAVMEALNPDEDFFYEANRRLIASGCGVLYWQH